MKVLCGEDHALQWKGGGDDCAFVQYHRNDGKINNVAAATDSLVTLLYMTFPGLKNLLIFNLSDMNRLS